MFQNVSSIAIMKLVITISYLLSSSLSLAGAALPMPKSKSSSATVLDGGPKVFKTASTHFDRVVYIDDQNFLKQTLFILTYDEDDYRSTNQVFTLLMGSAVKGDYLNHEKQNLRRPFTFQLDDVSK